MDILSNNKPPRPCKPHFSDGSHEGVYSVGVLIPETSLLTWMDIARFCSNKIYCISSQDIVYHSNMVRIQVTLYWFTFSQEIRAIILMWIIVDAVFLVAVISGMSVRLFLDPRKFMASIGKRIFSISTYPSQTGWLKFIFIFTLTLRRLMSYIYGAPILDVSRSHTTTHHSR